MLGDEMINLSKLNDVPISSGVLMSGCNINGIVWDTDGHTEIQKRTDVAAIIANLDSLPEPEKVKPVEEQLAELKAQVAVLSKTVDTSKLSVEDVAILGGGMVEEAL
jgi:hypothetical protein